MITCAIHAANKRHFDSLICDYLKNGYKIYLLEETFAQLHNKVSCVLIDYIDQGGVSNATGRLLLLY